MGGMRMRKKWMTIVMLAALPVLAGVSRTAERDDVNAPQPTEDWAENQLARMTLDEKIGQFFVIAAYSGKGETHLASIEQLVREQQVGGIIWFKGKREDYLSAAERMRTLTKVPLLYGMDAEWGVSMRLETEKRYPYAYSLGGADDPALSRKIAEMVAQECRELGIHINFAPVADVNSNPENPVIGFRSFGENPEKVGNHVAAFVNGFEQNGVASSIKHFPGHGDTDLDSHRDLPVINRSREEIDAIDWLPFREGIRNGASTVMVGHLSVPVLDPSGTPATLSKTIIGKYLKEQLGFKGVVISDALNMKAVADRYGKVDVAVKAFEAGCDVLLFPEDVPGAIAAIKQKVEKGEISTQEIDQRCLKLLKLKEKFVVNPPKFKSYTGGEQDWARYQTYEKAVVLAKNEDKVLPIGRMDQRVLHLSVGDDADVFSYMLDRFGDVKHKNVSFDAIQQGIANIHFEDYETVIVSYHARTLSAANNFGTPEGLPFLMDRLSPGSRNVLVIFGNPLLLSGGLNTSRFQSIVMAYENNEFVQNRAAQQVFGAIPLQGKLPFTIRGMYERESGLKTDWNGRLKFSQPEELGLKPTDFAQIDTIVNQAIEAHAFPGCQIVVAVKGKIILRKSYGTHQYNDQEVTNTDLYDIASITKIAGSTMGVMRLQSEGAFSLDATLKEYIPGTVGTSAYGNIVLRDMLAHRAGLKSWIPFYKYTLDEGVPSKALYSAVEKEGYASKVADNLFLKSGYTDSIYARILQTPLGSKKYEYSDLGYYFIKKIIEKKSGQSLDAFLSEEIYRPMGLRNVVYNPYKSFELARVVPTEDDKIYRHQLVHGYVHDPGAAMIGGVGGHAGLFSTATDLAAIMQLFLNKGNYGGEQYILPEVIAEYTKAQFPGNRRGAGFDRPKSEGGGTCHEVASQLSYGHSGFTGTLAWVDPKYDINYVFLSNRVYPDAENWKIVKMNIRTEIQRVIYEAVNKK